MTFDVVIIGAGLAGTKAATILQEAGYSCALFTKGTSLHKPSTEGFTAAGGKFFPGDAVTGGTFEGRRLKSIRTVKLQGTEIYAGQFILATGKFFAGGLAADMDKVRETVFGFDVEYFGDRSAWFDQDFSKPQPFLTFGLRTDEYGRVFRGRDMVENVFAAGEILCGIDSAGPDDEIISSAVKAAREVMRHAGK